jgi:hypothetical protein
MKMIQEINEKLPTHWAFFGPKWFCWMLVFIGALGWLIEPSLKSLGLYDYGPLYNLVNLTADALNSKKYLLFSVLLVVVSMVITSLMIHFPSFWVLTTNVISKDMTSGYLYIATLLFPLWFNFLFYRIIKMLN